MSLLALWHIFRVIETLARTVLLTRLSYWKRDGLNSCRLLLSLSFGEKCAWAVTPGMTFSLLPAPSDCPEKSQVYHSTETATVLSRACNLALSKISW